MVFSSNEFLFFFMPLAVLTNLALLDWFRGRGKDGLWWANLLLLLFSLVFYGWGEPRFLPLLVGSAVFNFAGGLLLSPGPERSDAWRKVKLTVLIAINLAAIGIFKYLNFFQDAGGVALLNRFLPEGLKIGAFGHIALPVGISFYTFQAISYLLDVYRGVVAPCSSFVTFACYLTMFPQLIAGPIVRFSDIHADLMARNIVADNVAAGCARFVFGLAKKVLLADTFGRVADAVFALDPSHLNPGYAWLGIVCYTLQIYFDFSAYSDMAIGIGHMLGIRFLENFNYPYFAKSIKDFWRRWHISLSTWFRDYLYIPLGGSRHGTLRTSFNLLVVFVLCGFWHGAAWNFMIWGLYHGFFLAVERVAGGRFSAFPGLVKRAYTLLAVILGWVLFRANDLSGASRYYQALFGFSQPDFLELNAVRLATHGYVLPLCLVIGAVLAMPVFPRLRDRSAAFLAKTASTWRKAVAIVAYRALLFGLLALSIGAIASSSYQSFIYFRF